MKQPIANTNKGYFPSCIRHLEYNIYIYIYIYIYIHSLFTWRLPKILDSCPRKIWLINKLRKSLKINWNEIVVCASSDTSIAVGLRKTRPHWTLAPLQPYPMMRWISSSNYTHAESEDTASLDVQAEIPLRYRWSRSGEHGERERARELLGGGSVRAFACVTSTQFTSILVVVLRSLQ